MTKLIDPPWAEPKRITLGSGTSSRDHDIVDPAWVTSQIEKARRERENMTIPERIAGSFGTTPEEAKSFGRRIAAEETGAVALGLRGARYGSALGPKGTAIGGALGAAAGALGGKRIDELSGNLRPEDKGFINDLTTALGGSLAIKVPAGRVTPTETQKAAQLFKGRGVRFTPGMVSDHAIVQHFEQVLSMLPTIGGNIPKRAREAYDDLGKAVDYLSDDATLRLVDPSDVGKAIQAGATKKIQAFHNRADALYKLARTIADDSPVSPSNTIRVLKDDLSWDNPALGDALIDPDVKTFLKALEVAPTQTWRDADRFREKIGRRMRSAQGEERFSLGQIYYAITDDMDVAAAKLGDKERRAWIKANDYYKRAIAGSAKQLEKVLSVKPETLWNSLQGKGNLTSIVTAKKAVDKDTWKGVQSAVLHHMGLNKENVFDVPTFVRNFNKLNRDTNAAKAMFGPLLGDVSDVAGIAQRMERPMKYANTSWTAPTAYLISLLSGISGAIYDPALALPLAGSALSPSFLSKLWTSPQMLKWMKVGRKAKNDRQKVAWVRAFAGLAAAEGMDVEDPDVQTFMDGMLEGIAANTRRREENPNRPINPGSLAGTSIPTI